MRRRSPALLAAGLTTVVSATVGLTACTPESKDASTGCEALIRDASMESEPGDQVRQLDQAMIVCGSFDAFTSNLARYPDSIGYDPTTYAMRRCEQVDDERVIGGATCAALITPATTAPPTTIASLVFVGTTVDGRPIEIRPSAEVPFVGEVPAVIQQTVDIALESECDGVLAQRDRWAAEIDDTPAGDIASVYAQHAQNVLDFIGCDTEPLTP